MDAWQLDSWEAYRDVPRLCRRTRLPENRRKALWSIFEFHPACLRHRRPPFDFAVVDEAQDIDNDGRLDDKRVRQAAAVQQLIAALASVAEKFLGIISGMKR